MRSRGGLFELKISRLLTQKEKDGDIDIYDEINDEKKIKEFLNINDFGDLQKL